MQTRNGRSPLKGKITGKIDQIRIKKTNNTGKRKSPKKTEDRSPEIQRKKSENIVFEKQKEKLNLYRRNYEKNN